MAKKHLMKNRPTKNTKGNHTLFIQLLLITLLSSSAVFPFIFDSFTVPKLLVLSAGLLIFSLKLLQVKYTSGLNVIPRWLVILGIFFLSTMFFSWSVSDIPFLRGAFGQFGRGNGLFYYFFTILILLFAIKTIDNSQTKTVHKLVTYLSWALAIYASLQSLGIDFAKLDTRGISPVVLTFGNSNFSGAMLAVLFTYNLLYVIASRQFTVQSISLLVFLVWGSTLTGAVQAYLIILFASALAVSLNILHHSKSVWISRALMASWLVGILTLILGLRGEFVLARIFERRSFQARIEYWKISIEIIRDNLLFGVGPDNLYDVTANYMSPGSLGIITTTRMDNAHNWYLNLAANYGILVLLFYMLILGSVFVYGIRNLSTNGLSRPFSTAAFAAFLALFIDGLVSIEQPGIGIWLYLFGGITIGSWINSVNPLTASGFAQKSKLKIELSRPHFFLAVLCVVCLTISTITISTRVAQDMELRRQIQSQLLGDTTESTIQKIQVAAISLKSEPEYATTALQTLAAMGAGRSLDEVSKASYEYNKNSIQATLIRADVLRALGRTDESCLLRITLLNNTPWDRSQLLGYLKCLTNGLVDSSYSQVLRKAYVYISTADPVDASDPDTSLQNANTALEISISSARINFLLGNLVKAKQDKENALKWLTKIEKLEKSAGIGASVPDRNDNLLLLNF